jgi:hypothetical protein
MCPARSGLGMMAHVRPSIRFGLLTCFTLASLAGLTLASPAGVAAAAAPEAPTRKERLEELWLDARGESGWIRTVPLFLDDQPGEYRFGPAYCGRSHRLGDETLRALQAALASGQPVRIDAEPATGDAARRCITGVAFFAP